ncbi:MAG: YitT family protein [Acutalibacteraceae bacterium]|jgi:uncharacterized membrane-anchored protein YitT (DUF2179 family)|nr:YitT family protein [Acutalibacteraceae bacterium]HJB62024.1 YitT family protein [Candidatus Ruminococcus gallistercoris]
MKNPVKQIGQAEIKNFLLITLGTVLTAVGIYFFKFPNNFSTGGVSGISILLGKLVPFLSPAVSMWVINLILLLIGFLFFGRGFGLMTAYCSMLYSFLTWLFEVIYPMTAPFTDQPFLELCFAMMLPAVGSAILFNCNASTGGTDIVAMILKKYTSLDIGKALLVSDALIAFSACFVFDIRTGLFSLLGLIIKAFVVDSVIESINLCKYFSIVTSCPDAICDYIIREMNRSSTVIDAIGAYSHEDRKVILVACRRSEAVRLRQYIKTVDPKAFMFITNTSEIIGKGFRTV